MDGVFHLGTLERKSPPPALAAGRASIARHRNAFCELRFGQVVTSAQGWTAQEQALNPGAGRNHDWLVHLRKVRWEMPW